MPRQRITIGVGYDPFNPFMEIPMSDADYYPNEYKKYKDELKKLEDSAQGTSKEAGKIRAMLIQIWNKMTPPQQTEVATKYVTEV